MISQSRITFALVVLLALLQLGGGGAVGFYLFTDASEVTHVAGLVRAVGVRLGGSAVIDAVIAVAMTYILLRSKGQAFWAHE
ncbi:hypothetical protein B0H10DRAFT_2317106 [Mycena sp. CBHHK59/15]|nr:hypothetical protein B0H10DRAFT_2317106 [Mycena sp. CBHHK59/15]